MLEGVVSCGSSDESGRRTKLDFGSSKPFDDHHCDIMSTRLRDATSIQFLVHPSVSDYKDWNLFTVHSAGGQRLLKVTPDANPVNHSSLQAATDALFMAIAERSSAPAGSR